MIDKKEIEVRIKSLKKSGINLFHNLSDNQKSALLYIEDDESCKPKQGTTDAAA